MANRPNGEIIHFSDGVLSLMCGKLLLQAHARICDCSDGNFRLKGTVTNGPLHIYGKSIMVVSHDHQEAIISVQRRSA